MSGIEPIGDHVFHIANGTDVTVEKAGTFVRHIYDFGDGHRLVFTMPPEVGVATQNAYNKAIPSPSLRQVQNVYPLPERTPGDVA